MIVAPVPRNRLLAELASPGATAVSDSLARRRSTSLFLRSPKHFGDSGHGHPDPSTVPCITKAFTTLMRRCSSEGTQEQQVRAWKLHFLFLSVCFACSLRFAEARRKS